MTHAEFVEQVREHFWSIRDPHRAFGLAWGALGECVFWLQLAVCVFVPLGLLGSLCVSERNYWLAAWAPAVLWTALVSNRTVIGLLPALVLVVVVGLPLWLAFGKAQFLAALTSVAAFVIAVTVKALTTSWFIRRLVRSPQSWERVSKAGLLRQG